MGLTAYWNILDWKESSNELKKSISISRWQTIDCIQSPWTSWITNIIQNVIALKCYIETQTRILPILLANKQFWLAIHRKGRGNAWL